MRNITCNPGDALREQRLAAKLTQRDVAVRAGCSARYVQMLEAGRVPRRSRVLSDILRVLRERG